MLRRSAVLFSVIGCLAALVLAGCGSKSSSSTPAASGGATATTSAPGTGVHFAKTKFVFHAGLAFGAFHRYVYKPFKAGAFSHPLSHKAAIVKGALAALFTFHELRLAAVDVRASKILRTLFSPLIFVADRLRVLAAEITGGHVRGADVNAINTGISGISSSAGASGATIVERVPNAGQLSAGAFR